MKVDKHDLTGLNLYLCQWTQTDPDTRGGKEDCGKLLLAKSVDRARETIREMPEVWYGTKSTYIKVRPIQSEQELREVIKAPEPERLQHCFVEHEGDYLCAPEYMGNDGIDVWGDFLEGVSEPTPLLLNLRERWRIEANRREEIRLQVKMKL